MLLALLPSVRKQIHKPHPSPVQKSVEIILSLWNGGFRMQNMTDYKILYRATR